MSVKLLTEYHLEFLSLKGEYTGSSESTLVNMPHCWKSHVTAQMLFQAAVGIKCSCKPGFVGDGKDACNGDVYSTLLTLSEATQFVKVSEALQILANWR